MPLSGPLFDRVASAPSVAPGLPLVIALTGFTDAGSAVAGLIDYLREDLDPTPLLVYSNDVLLDYRARRPIISFEEDHLTDYRPARLELSLAHDALGHPFLLLAGYEPDFAWDAFARTVLEFADEAQVSSVTWVHAIPMPVPHTRPIGTTVSGTRPELIAAHSVWKPRTRVPGTVGHLLEFRFAERGVAVSGFVLLVPHYLGDTDFPGATLAALDKVTVATGLMFVAEELRSDDRDYLDRVNEQVEGNEELSRMVRGLEERYDAYMAGLDSGEATRSVIDESQLPSADELAAELERYLATRQAGEDDKRS
ncbi:MAG: PAC2 family protein [Protaetiibacter sp.]